jgi:hypothetical protein
VPTALLLPSHLQENASLSIPLNEPADARILCKQVQAKGGNQQELNSTIPPIYRLSLKMRKDCCWFGFSWRREDLSPISQQLRTICIIEFNRVAVFTL